MEKGEKKNQRDNDTHIPPGCVISTFHIKKPIQPRHLQEKLCIHRSDIYILWHSVHKDDAKGNKEQGHKPVIKIDG